MSIPDYIILLIFWFVVLFLAFKAFKAIRRKRKRYIVFAVYSILILLWFWAGLDIGIPPGSRAYSDYRVTRNLFGTGILLGYPEIEYNSERSFHGDGYSIIVYQLNDGEINEILPMLSQQIQSLPTRYAYRSDWQQTFWRQTPIKQEEQEFLEFALLMSASDEGLKKSKKLLDELAHQPGHYYSYFYKMSGQNPSDIDFFLFSPVKKLLILVNFNT